jgi:hypothetical protein
VLACSACSALTPALWRRQGVSLVLPQAAARAPAAARAGPHRRRPHARLRGRHARPGVHVRGAAVRACVCVARVLAGVCGRAS